MGERWRPKPPERPQSDSSVAGACTSTLRHGAHRLEAGTTGVLTRPVRNRAGEECPDETDPTETGKILGAT